MLDFIRRFLLNLTFFTIIPLILSIFSDIMSKMKEVNKMTVIFNLINKILAPILCILLSLTGGLNSIFNGNVAEFKDLGGVVGLETLARAQGVTADGDDLIYSGKSVLERVSKDNKTILAINTNAIPDKLAALGVKHIGGISVYNGILYASLEDSKVYHHPVIALYDANTLEFTGTYYELPTERHTKGVPWVAVDSENGILYAADWNNLTGVYMYDLETMDYVGELKYSEEIKNVQGGEVYNGKLYLGTNDITRSVYSVETATGKAEKLFDRIAYEYKYIDNFGGEGEDLTIAEYDGEMLICTLQIGVTFTDATLRGYKIP